MEFTLKMNPYSPASLTEVLRVARFGANAQLRKEIDTAGVPQTKSSAHEIGLCRNLVAVWTDFDEGFRDAVVNDGAAFFHMPEKGALKRYLDPVDDALKGILRDNAGASCIIVNSTHVLIRWETPFSTPYGGTFDGVEVMMMSATVVTRYSKEAVLLKTDIPGVSVMFSMTGKNPFEKGSGNEKSVRVTIPKFLVKACGSVLDELAESMPELKAQSPLSGLTVPHLISDIIHSCSLAVDQFGVVADAATVIVTKGMSSAVVFDQPFSVFVVAGAEVLFTARIDRSVFPDAPKVKKTKR